MRHTALREQLVARRRELIARYHDTLRRADEELSTRDPEDVERATEQWDARVLGTLSHADLRDVVKLTEAIERIDAGSYGVCSDCGHRIPAARLAALPAARTCAGCAFAAEARP
jgi:RNA polymerase-binding transcription factor DksA